MWNNVEDKATDNTTVMNYNRIVSNSTVINAPNSVETPAFILTNKSPRDPTPTDSPVQLWPHQEAMLYRIRAIEKAGYLCHTEHTQSSMARYMDKTDMITSYKVCLGIMNDPPGSGKTYAILSHILSDVENTGTNVIIVPQNIYAQWKQSIEVVFKVQLDTCKFSSSYADIINMYGNPESVNKYKIVLLQDSFAEAYLKALNDNEIEVCRIIVDEIDIMDKMVCSSVKTKFVWLMSASYKDQKILGPYHIGDHTRVVCKCDSDFVKEAVNLPDTSNQTILCDDEHIQVFQDILEPNHMKSLNAGDHSTLTRIMNAYGQITPLTYKEIIQKYSEYLFGKSDELEESNKELERISISFMEDGGVYNKERNILMDKISQLKRYREQSQTLLKRLDSLPDINTLNYKEKYLQSDIVNTMLNDTTNKWLIFNDNGNVLIKYQDFLLTKGIKGLMLDGGNQKLIEKTLKEYKEGDVRVLLLNSMIEGAGMNLENTTHLLFMHKTEEKFIEQVMGRAQRYGRTTPLNVIMLFNKNE